MPNSSGRLVIGITDSCLLGLLGLLFRLFVDIMPQSKFDVTILIIIIQEEFYADIYVGPVSYQSGTLLFHQFRLFDSHTLHLFWPPIKTYPQIFYPVLFGYCLTLWVRRRQSHRRRVNVNLGDLSSFNLNFTLTSRLPRGLLNLPRRCLHLGPRLGWLVCKDCHFWVGQCGNVFRA